MEATAKTQTQTVKDEKTQKPNADKLKKQRPTSMEALGEQLLKSKASQESIIKAFTSAYKLKGKTDKLFIQARAAIYMKIAQKRATEK